jgi:hypothetical protein
MSFAPVRSCSGSDVLDRKTRHRGTSSTERAKGGSETGYTLQFEHEDEPEHEGGTKKPRCR